MRFFPHEKYEIETSIPPLEAKKRIETLIVAKPTFIQWFGRSFVNIIKPAQENQFIGEMTNDTFRLTRLIYYQNSFLPIIEGQLLPHPFGTKLEITMTLHPSTAMFSTIWFIGTSLMFLLLIPFILKDGFHPTFLIPLVMLLSWAALVQFGFRSEARKTIKIFSSLFPNAGEQITAADSSRSSSGAPLAKT